MSLMPLIDTALLHAAAVLHDAVTVVYAHAQPVMQWWVVMNVAGRGGWQAGR